ncbi:MAG: zinc metalloprotease HtpX [Candidatus Omnitrophica bacterium]|jgi:heat shock protein HtpX|nr:zinc metalloprotease HtpX [Candidatus Omnitrophota bacterium]
MAFSFIDIENKKSKEIIYLFILLIAIYFLTVYLGLSIILNRFLAFNQAIIALLAAFVFAAGHWIFSTSNLLGQITQRLGTDTADPEDNYHKVLQNVVDEVSVAIGGRKIQALVIPDASLNAFALEDFNGNAVIGVTEGLLSRLSRSQIEAVVAHEAGHIASHDSLTTTISCSLAEIYNESLKGLNNLLRKSRQRVWPALFLLYLVMMVMNFLSLLLRMCVSRQREYRADALSVRLTRNPLSLAEALMIISGSWHGTGIEGEALESIFIVNPRLRLIDEKDGFMARLFSTHPPIQKRISILLDMGHLDGNTLEERLRAQGRNYRPTVAQEIALEHQTNTQNPRWKVMEEGVWEGPFSLAQIKEKKDFSFDSWVMREDKEEVFPAYYDPVLAGIFLRESEGEQSKLSCPRCKIALGKVNYEGLGVFKCPSCLGYLLPSRKISRILIREVEDFGQNIIDRAEVLIKTKNKFKLPMGRDLSSVWVYKCPNCQRQMHREFFLFSYPIEVDKCIYCGNLWFEKDQLQILEYIYQNKQRFFPAATAQEPWQEEIS